MQRQPTRDTAPELALRRLLHARGLRYRVDAAPLPGLRRRADIVFGPAKVVVFIDGCFWHGCPEHGQRTPHANPGYWTGKVARNRARDADTDARLDAAGWVSLRYWEHGDPSAAAAGIEVEVAGRRPSVNIVTGQPRQPEGTDALGAHETGHTRATHRHTRQASCGRR